MLDVGAKLAAGLEAGDIVYLNGPLGAGKTTLTRGVLRALGYTTTVSSPTYAMVEEYDLANFTLYHFDGYRLHNEEEWLDMGVDDYLHDKAVCLIEWPDTGLTVLPQATMTIDIALSECGRDVTVTLSQSERDLLSSCLKECLACR